ncbi:hypothetical protein J6590_023983 [Homalodisca vitripennis]|nr:hypothetical protein J6590_023983 [Homalodisca vitripennis]
MIILARQTTVPKSGLQPKPLGVETNNSAAARESIAITTLCTVHGLHVAARLIDLEETAAAPCLVYRSGNIVDVGVGGDVDVGVSRSADCLVG